MPNRHWITPNKDVENGPAERKLTVLKKLKKKTCWLHSPENRIQKKSEKIQKPEKNPPTSIDSGYAARGCFRANERCEKIGAGGKSERRSEGA